MKYPPLPAFNYGWDTLAHGGVMIYDGPATHS